MTEPAARRSLSELLVEAKMVRPRALDRLEREARGDQMTLTDKAVEMRMISGQQAADILARYLGVPRINLRGLEFAPYVTGTVPYHLARHYHAVPVSRCDDRITVAVSTPDPEPILAGLRRFTGYAFDAVVAEPGQLAQAIVGVYSRQPKTREVVPERPTWPAGRTFPVAEVEVAAEPLTELPLKSLLFRDMGPIECCSDENQAAVASETPGNVLLQAAWLSFSQHRPLVLSPDMIWLALGQGLVRHVLQDAGRWRDRLAGFAGKKELRVLRDAFDPQSFGDWMQVWDDLGRQVRETVGPRLPDFLGCNFSTTGRLERAASDIGILELHEAYFDYSVLSVCGIPSVTLEGTPADWQAIEGRLEGLASFDLAWWVDRLRPIMRQFVRAASGDVDPSFWRDLYQRHDPDTQGYGGPHERFTGWIGRLLPYTHSKRNPLLAESDTPVYLSQFPAALSSSVVRCESGRYRCTAGLVALQQSLDTRAIRPRIGWVVRKING
ncbi:MAG TPA: DUF4419 domain-containing protein [Candidatus Xenobia bacterium]|jgi:hypothetical protein